MRAAHGHSPALERRRTRRAHRNSRGKTDHCATSRDFAARGSDDPSRFPPRASFARRPPAGRADPDGPKRIIALGAPLLRWRGAATDPFVALIERAVRSGRAERERLTAGPGRHASVREVRGGAALSGRVERDWVARVPADRGWTGSDRAGRGPGDPGSFASASVGTGSGRTVPDPVRTDGGAAGHDLYLRRVAAVRAGRRGLGPRMRTRSP